MGDGLVGEGNIMAVLFGLDTSQKVAGSIPEDVVGMCHAYNRSGNMYIGSTQPPKGMSMRKIFWKVKLAGSLV
jgi:hypothetical protein